MQFRHLLLSTVFALLLFWPSSQYGATSGYVVIVGFGDSITKGYPDMEEDGNGRRVGGYEPTLEQLLDESQRDAFVLNYGIGGESTSNGLHRFDEVLEASQANYVLLLEGTNDLYIGVSPQTVAENLRFMIRKVKDFGATPVISPLTPDTEADKPISEMNSLIEILAEREDTLLCDQYEALVDNWDDLTDDGLHPNTEGYETMASAWFATIAPLIPQRENIHHLTWLSLLLN